MKYILTALVLIISTSCWSQGRVYITAVGGVDYSNCRYTDGLPAVRQWMTDTKKPAPGYHAGLDLGIRLYQHLYFKTGLRYFDAGLAEVFETDVLVPGQMLRVKIKSTYSYLEIPIGLRYQFGKGKLSWFAETGITTNVYLSNQQKIIIDGNKTDLGIKDTAAKKVVLNTYIAIGAQYRLSHHFQVYLQPTFRYSVTPMTSSTIPMISENLKTYTYSIGGEFGLRYLLP